MGSRVTGVPVVTATTSGDEEHAGWIPPVNGRGTTPHRQTQVRGNRFMTIARSKTMLANVPSL